MDDAIVQLRELVRHAKKKCLVKEFVSVDLMLYVLDRLDQTPACIRQVSTHDLLVELLNREARRQNFPEAMKTGARV